MINIDRDKASAVGLSAGQIENALQSAYSSYQISTIYAPNNEYQVIIEIDPKYSRDPPPFHCSMCIQLGKPGSSQHGRKCGSDSRSGNGQSPGAVSFSNHLLQPGTGQVSRRRCERCSNGGPGDCAVDDHKQPPGNSAGICIVHVRIRHPDPGGNIGHLHRAGDPL